MSSPLDFVTNFLKQPYPTMGLTPSTAPTKTGGTVVLQGSGSDGALKTGDTMWGRIASALPFGWTLSGLAAVPTGVATATQAVKSKVEEGAQAVDGKVKSISDGASGFFSGYVSTVKWGAVALLAIAFIVFAAQVKTLVRSD